MCCINILQCGRFDLVVEHPTIVTLEKKDDQKDPLFGLDLQCEEYKYISPILKMSCPDPWNYKLNFILIRRYNMWLDAHLSVL